MKNFAAVPMAITMLCAGLPTAPVLGEEPASGGAAIRVTNTAPQFGSLPEAIPSQALVAQRIAFIASATGGDGDGITYSRDFGDGTSGSGETPTHAYAVDGNVTVTATATDGVLSTTSRITVQVFSTNATFQI